MTVLSDYVARMVAAGVDQEEAFQMVAEIFAAGAAGASARSSNAKRQQRFRDKKRAAETVTKRYESVTKRYATEDDQTVTKRYEVTDSNACDSSHISYLPSSIEIIEKKESKKERKSPRRNAPLPDDWHPSLRSLQIAEEHGVNAQVVEQIFRDYLKSSGKLYADYDAAFNNFIRNQHRFNGNSYGKAQSRSGGSLMDAIDRQLAAASLAEKPDPALPADSVLRIPDRSIR